MCCSAWMHSLQDAAVKVTALTRHLRQQSPLLHWEPAVRVQVLQHSPPSLAHSWGTHTLITEYMGKADEPQALLQLLSLARYLNRFLTRLLGTSRQKKAHTVEHEVAVAYATQEIIFLTSQCLSLHTDILILTRVMFPSRKILSLTSFKAQFCTGSYDYYSCDKKCVMIK